MKGNGGSPAIEDELDQLLWPGCFPRLARDLELNGGASGGFHRRRGEFNGARVLGSERGTRDRRRTGALGFPAMAAVSSL
jgi:hypothetical protein